MYRLTLDDLKGNKLEFGMYGDYTISAINGLSSPTANINMSDLALLDGQKFNSAKAQPRTLDIAFAVEGDAEANRLKAYKVLRIKNKIRMYYRSERVNVFIDGYIKNVVVTHFEMKQIMTVTIVCPQPYFKSAIEIVDDLSLLVKAFHFPFAITAEKPIPFSYIQEVSSALVSNAGGIDTGIVIEMTASGSVINPKIYNYMTREFIGINFEFVANDFITICTVVGEKSVTLLREGQTINLFNYLMDDITWLQLDNSEISFVYEYTGMSGVLAVEIKHHDLYEGV